MSYSYFRRKELIYDIARTLAKSQGYRVDQTLNLDRATNPRTLEYIRMAEVAIIEIEKIADTDITEFLN